MEASVSQNTKESLSKTISRGIVYFTGQNALSKIFALISTFILIKFLGVYEYGLLILARSAFDTFNNFTNIGISSTVLADMNVERSKGNVGAFKAIFIDYISFKSFIAAITWAVVFFGINLIGTYYTNDVVPYIKLFSVLLLINPFRTIITNILNVHLKFTALAYWSVLESVIYLLGILLILVLNRFDIWWVIVATIVSQLLVMVVYIPVFWKTSSYLFFVNREKGNHIWKIIRQHGKWGILENYISGITKNIRPWIVSFFLGVESTAIYGVAQSLMGHLSSVVPISRVLGPIFPLNQNDRKKMAELFFRSVKYSFFIMCGVLVVSYVAMPYFIGFFFPKYISSIPIFNIMAIALIFVALSGLLNPLFDTFKLQKHFFGLTLVKFGVLVVLAVPLTYYFGLKGMAVEFVLTTFIFMYLRYAQLVRIAPELKLSFVRMFKYDNIDRDFFRKILYRLKFIKR